VDAAVSIMNHMFASVALAARIDRAEGRLCAGIARAVAAHNPGERSVVIDIAGGVAVFAAAGSPTNKMIGIAFDAAADERALEAVEAAFAERGADLQAEVSTLASPAMHALLARRGYEPRGFEHQLGHSLAAIDPGRPDGVAIDVIGREELDAFIDVLAAGFSSPDTGGVGGDVTPPSGALRSFLTLTMQDEGFRPFAARVDGTMVGAASLRIDGGIAQFTGAATLPAFRRRGVQTALLRERLCRAREAGCELAVVTTQPASKSQQNVQREGFELLYARQLFVKTA
jgi:GNAT superfamily N-acetyltransferase